MAFSLLMIGARGGRAVDPERWNRALHNEAIL
jgi:hypothetical protein